MKDLRIAYILDNDTLVLNAGSDAGLETGQRFLVYGLSTDDIIDPETSKSLGKLEIVRGTGVITSVQERMSIITSDTRRPTLNSLATLMTPIEPDSFHCPAVGDYARLI